MRRMSTTSRIAAALASDTAEDRRGRRRARIGDRRRPRGPRHRRRTSGRGDGHGDAGWKAADAAVETMEVKMALSTDTRVDASNINVDTDHVTKTVTLRGRVPSAAQKALAGEIAKTKATGYTVQNLLVVAP